MNDVRIVWFAQRDEYVVLDAKDRELFWSKRLIDCEDFLLGRQMRNICE